MCFLREAQIAIHCDTARGAPGARAINAMVVIVINTVRNAFADRLGVCVTKLRPELRGMLMQIDRYLNLMALRRLYGTVAPLSLPQEFVGQQTGFPNFHYLAQRCKKLIEITDAMKRPIIQGEIKTSSHKYDNVVSERSHQRVSFYDFVAAHHVVRQEIFEWRQLF
jgi:hypothetical protein